MIAEDEKKGLDGGLGGGRGRPRRAPSLKKEVKFDTLVVQDEDDIPHAAVGLNRGSYAFDK